MADKRIRVDLQPLVRITWPDGAQHVYSQEDLAQLVYTLIIEELLVVQLGRCDRILKGLELELTSADDGTLILRGSGLTNPPR